MANPAVGRTTRTAHATGCLRHLHRIARSAHAALRRPGRGSLGPLAVGTRHRRQDLAPRQRGTRAVQVRVGNERRTSGGRHGCESDRQSLERADTGSRSRRRGHRGVHSADGARARTALSRDVDVLSVRSWYRRWPVASSRRADDRGLEGLGRRVAGIGCGVTRWKPSRDHGSQGGQGTVDACHRGRLGIQDADGRH